MGAVYTPELVMDPPTAPSCMDQVTALFSEPSTAATNVSAAPCVTTADEGEMESDVEGDTAGDKGVVRLPALPHPVNRDKPANSKEPDHTCLS